MEANQGVESAQQVLKQDPNNADAKATIQKNQGIIDALLSDPKKRKQIGKAFDISFVDPSQNNKPEHAALKTAVDSYSEQLQKKMPTQMAPNVQAQQKLGQLQATGKLIDDQIKSIQSGRLTDAYARMEIEGAKLSERQQEESDKVAHWNEQAQQRSQEFATKIGSQQAMAKLLANTRMGVAALQANSRLEAIQKAIDGRLKYADHIGLGQGPGSAKFLNGNIALMQKALAQLPTQVLQAQTLYNDPKASPEDKKNLQDYINKTEELQTMYRNQIEQDQIKLSTLMDMGDQNGAGSDNNSGSDITIPKVLNPNGARPEKSSTTQSGPQESSKPVVNQTGPQSDTNTDQQYLNIIKQNLANQ
jgi:hypothetical protein